MANEPVTPTSVRIPTDLFQRLMEESESNSRPLSREIVHRLRKSFGTASAVEANEEQTVLRQIAADIRAMREMQEKTLAAKPPF